MATFSFGSSIKHLFVWAISAGSLVEVYDGSVLRSQIADREPNAVLRDPVERHPEIASGRRHGKERHGANVDQLRGL
jgi:hypothetical protein